MPDQIGTAEQLQAMPGLADLAQATADQLLHMGTTVVQAVVDQRLVITIGDEADLLGTSDNDLYLPQRPVTGITSVAVDGAEVTDYLRYGARLWRECGWADPCKPRTPSTVSVVYDHGLDDDDWRIGFARSTVLMLAAGAALGSPGVTSEGIDDYQVVYDRMAARMEGSEFLTRALRRNYGPRAGLARVG